MGIGLPPLEFTDCVSDSPHFRRNLHDHEKELENTSSQIKRLIKELKDLLSAAKNLSRAQRSLSNSLQAFSFECIGTTQTEDELVIAKSLAEFGRLISCIEDERDRMMDRAYDQIILPLENFRKEHIGGVKEGRKKFEKQTAKFCQSQERYLNLSTKKQDTFLQEADATLEMEQRHFIRASLEYVFLLQEVQERKKFEFVEILLSFMFGWLTFYHQGHEVAEDFKPYMRELQLRIQKTRENFKATRDKAESLMKKTMEMRHNGPCGPNRKFSKEGYLYLMEKKAFGATWTKQYCTYQKDKKEFSMIPYNQISGKFNPGDKMTVTSCIRRMSDSIEKRFCFDITCVDRPGIVFTLQALSEEDRKEWMDVMDGKEPMYGVPAAVPVKNQGVKNMNPEEKGIDELGFLFITKCIDVLDTRGLEEQGLYRVVGVTSKVSKLLTIGKDKKKFEKLQLDDPREWDSKTITSAIKTYLRNLPEPIMTFRLHHKFIQAAKLENRQSRINAVHAVTHMLPQVNFNMLEILIRHLNKVASMADKNLMTVSNLAVCFGPTLLRPEEETVATIIDIKFCNVVVEILVDNYLKIFKTPPPIEEPILEPTYPPPGQPQYSNHNALAYMNYAEDGAQLPPSDHHTRLGLPPGVLPPDSGSSVKAKIRQLTYQNTQQLDPTHQIRDRSGGNSALRKHNVFLKSGTDLENRSSSNDSISSSGRDMAVTSAYPKPSPSSSSPQHKINYHKGGNRLENSGVRVNVGSSLGYNSSTARTLYACLGENEGELSFEPNQLITNVKSSVEPGWLEGTLDGKTGLVPENYVELLPRNSI